MSAQNENVVFDSTKLRTRLSSLMADRGYWTAKGPDIKRLSAGLNMSPAALSRYIAGQRTPDIAYLIQIASFFKVPTDWLLGITDSPELVRAEDVPEEALLPENEAERLISLFQKASQSDQEIIKIILSKYEK